MRSKNSHRKITMTHTQTTYINCIALCAGKKGARPAEVGALASVFEKSATKLKQQKLLKCKQTIQIATFNVRTLNRIGQSSRRHFHTRGNLSDKFTYLGSSVSSTKKDIDMRLTKAWTAIDKLSIIWKSDLTDKMKRSFFQAAVV